MKICLVAPRVGKTNGAFLGGSVGNVVNLSKELAKRHEIHLVTTPPWPSSEVIGIDWANVHKLNVKGEEDSLRYGFEFLIKSINKIKKLYKQEKFDIINSHAGTPKLGVVSGVAGKTCNVPSIHTQYTPITPASKITIQHNKMFTNRLLSSYRLLSSPFFSKYYISQVNCIIGTSKNVAESVSGLLHKEVKVVLPCIDLSRFDSFNKAEVIRSKFDLNNEKIILFLGERESKGIEVLIEAVKEIKKKVDVKVIIGAGLQKERVRKKVKDIEDSVILLDVIEDIPSLLAISDVFVAPFLDSFDILDCPLSVLEAMAAGKPVIASNLRGISEIIEHEKNGILIEPNNADKLAEAVIPLLEDEGKRQELGKNAYCHIKENFSAEKIAREYEEIYEEMIEG